MATVTNLADRVSTYTGLSTTGAERTLILEFLNDCYADAVEKSEVLKTSSAPATLTTGVFQYDITQPPFSLTDILKIESVFLSNSSYSDVLLLPKSGNWIRQQRSGFSSTPATTPLNFATPWPGAIWFYPTPDATTTSVTIDYIKTPPTLVESAPGVGEETTPTAFPALFHYRILANGAIAMALDSDQRKDSQPWWDKYYAGITDLVAWTNEFTGAGTVLPLFDKAPRRMSRDRSVDYYG